MTCFSPKSSDIETFLYFFRITLAIIAKIAQYVYMAKLQPYKREMAQKAIDAKKEHSTPYSRSAVNMGVPVRTLNGWVNALLSEQAKEEIK
jgi:hypothetical protein